MLKTIIAIMLMIPIALVVLCSVVAIIAEMGDELKWLLVFILLGVIAYLLI